MAELIINLAAARFNLDRLRSRSAAAARIMLVAKSDFYGLGLDVASALEPSVDLLAVNSLDEALALERQTSSKEIVVLYPPPPGESLARLVRGCLAHRRIVPTLLPTPAYASQLRAEMTGAQGASLRCYLLIPQPGDRFWSDADWAGVVTEYLGRRELDVCGAFTHFAEAHCLEASEAERRLGEVTGEVRGRWPSLPFSVADSFLAGRGQGLALDFCRVGLLPLAAMEPEAAADWSLRTVLTLKASVVNSYTLPNEGRVGYDLRPRAAGTNVAILDVGFASGLPFEFFRHCSASAGNGRRYPFVETPWMEYSGLLTGKETLPVGVDVELFGETESVGAQSARAGLPVEAMFLHLSRVAKRVLGP